MNAKKFSDSLGELDAKYVDEALNYKKKTKKTIWISAAAAAACLLLIGAAVISKPVKKIENKDGANLPSTSETQDNTPVHYSSLMSTSNKSNEEALKLFSESGYMMDITKFEESDLLQNHCCMIIEGTVEKLYVKHYNYDIKSDKFEEGGVLHGKTDTVVYEVAVDKSWYGENLSGKTVLIEDSAYFADPTLAIKEGGRYVLPIYKCGDKILTPGDEYADGNIMRETTYSTIYPYHPQIAVASDGSYLVSEDWTSLINDYAKKVIIDDMDNDNYWKDKVYSLDEDLFASQMNDLIEKGLE